MILLIFLSLTNRDLLADEVFHFYNPNDLSSDDVSLFFLILHVEAQIFSQNTNNIYQQQNPWQQKYNKRNVLVLLL